MPAPNVVAVDHIAVAVTDLDAAIAWVTSALGCSVQEERQTVGKHSGMRSAVVCLGALTLVLVQGTEAGSQVSEFVDRKGCGVQHIALRVQSIAQAVESLQARGVAFATPVLRDEQAGLAQIFTLRDPATGLMVEFIERGAGSGFSDSNVTRLFETLEERQLY